MSKTYTVTTQFNQDLIIKRLPTTSDFIMFERGKSVAYGCYKVIMSSPSKRASTLILYGPGDEVYAYMFKMETLKEL